MFPKIVSETGIRFTKASIFLTGMDFLCKHRLSDSVVATEDWTQNPWQELDHPQLRKSTSIYFFILRLRNILMNIGIKSVVTVVLDRIIVTWNFDVVSCLVTGWLANHRSFQRACVPTCMSWASLSCAETDQFTTLQLSLQPFHLVLHLWCKVALKESDHTWNKTWAGGSLVASLGVSHYS